MRALAQGLDERASWDRYLRLEGEHADLRNVRRTVAWIRDEFAAAAKREQRPGTARLILLDPSRFDAAPSLPTLTEFALAHGLEDFSEAEQIEAYEDAYPAGAGAAGGPSRRARLIDRQLEALRWLQSLVAQEPQADDGVGAWLNPTLAGRLERAGLPTLRAVCERINGIGARWWAQVPGIGERKAARIVDWLSANQAVNGLQLGAHADRPKSQLPPATLAAVVPPATAIRPFEKFVLPAALDGSAGPRRNPAHVSLMKASNDQEAIGEWLATKIDGRAPHALSPTQRSYRREAERLLLWAVLERQTALSELTTEDVHRYEAFLANPPAAWCGPRHHQRWSPLWRPLEGALSPAALRQALVIVRGMFVFFIRKRYLREHPFATMSITALDPTPSTAERRLSFLQWERIEGLLRNVEDTEAHRRLRRAMRWICATGMRPAELAQLRCGDLQPVNHSAGDPGVASGTAWLVTLAGRGGRRKQVPVPAVLVDELAGELARHGFDGGPGTARNHFVPVLARFEANRAAPPGWSTSGLYQAIKGFLNHAARGLEPDEAEQLRRASAHWLRQVHGDRELSSSKEGAPRKQQASPRSRGPASSKATPLRLPSGSAPAKSAQPTPADESRPA